MKSDTSSLKTIIKELDFLTKTVIIQWNTWKKDLLSLANKSIGKILDPCNAKEHYRLFIKIKPRKISKTIKNN